jgi:PAS domain S-box-containing protein
MPSSKPDFVVDSNLIVFVYGIMLLGLYGVSPLFDAINFFIGVTVHSVGFYAMHEFRDKLGKDHRDLILCGYATSIVAAASILTSISIMLLMMPVMVIFITASGRLLLIPAVMSCSVTWYFHSGYIPDTFSFASSLAIIFYLNQKIRSFSRCAAMEAEALTLLKDRSSAHLAFVGKMSEGVYSDTNIFLKNDALGKILFETGLKLKSTAQQDESRKWEMSGFNEISSILRSNRNVQLRYRELLSFIVKHLHVNQGGFFILNEQQHPAHSLELQACYAYDKQRMMKKIIDVNEGLVGQCVVEGEMIYLEQIPGGYAQITSGLGLATPTSLAIIPLKHDSDVVGVLELASLSKFSDQQLQFMEKISGMIGATVFFEPKNAETVRMLEESRSLEAELREQQEETRQNLEELEATQENLRREANEREKLQRELTRSKEFLNLVLDTVPIPVFVKDRNHKMVLLNKAVCELNNMSKDRMLGKTDYDFFSRQEADVFWNFEEEIFRSKSGAEKIEHAIRNGKETYTLDKKLYVQTDAGEDFLIGINIDVTHSKMMEINAGSKYVSKVL